jgi:hypothetical protein
MRFLCSIILIMGAGCLEPTEILVSLQTDVPCDQIRAFAYSFSLPADIERTVATKRIDGASPKFSCQATASGNLLGTVALAPIKRAGSEIALRASLRFNSEGVDERTGHACIAGREGCIQQDAVVSYVPGRTARFSMVLNRACAQVTCPLGLTCFSQASCQDVRVPLACANPNCASSTSDVDTPRFSALDAGQNSLGTDSGATDAGTTDAGTTDAGTTDAGTADAGITDAGLVDAGTPRIVGRNTIAAGSDFGDMNYINATRVMSPHTGVANVLWVYVRQVDADPTHRHFQMAVYGDNNVLPSTLLAASAVKTLTANSWNSVPIAVALNAGTTYWLAYNTDALDSNANNFATSPVPGAKSVYVSRTFGSYPSSFPSLEGQDTDSFSMYLELTP